MSGDILVVVGNRDRRVEVARRLTGRGHRVTISSSIDEAREILQFITHRAAAPQAVVIGEDLLERGGCALRESLDARFPGICWIPLPGDRDLGWLADWLDKPAIRQARQHQPGVCILLVEADDAMRDAVAARLEWRGDRVIACRSWNEASEALAIASSSEEVPHIIASPVILPEGNGISFYLAVRRRFPNIRWNVTSPGRHSVAPKGDEPPPLPNTSAFDLQSLPTPQVGTSHTPN
jgi:DNA-binding NtrC family response regulator